MKLIRITTIPLSLDKLIGPQLTFMSQYFEVTAVAADSAKLKRVADLYCVRHYHVEMTREITPIADLRAVWKLFLFLRKERPLIVHTHTPKAGIVGMLAAKLAGVPNRLHTVAGMPLMEATGFKRVVLDRVEKLTYSAATKVYPNSKGLYDFIIENRYTLPQKLKVIANGSSNGIDTAVFSPDQMQEHHVADLQRQLNLSPKDFVFIFVGRLVGDKGINELIAAFKNLASASLSHRAADDPQLQDLPTLVGNPAPKQQWAPKLNDSTTQRLKKSTSSIKLLLVGPLETALDPLSPDTLKEIEDNPDIVTVGYQQDVRPYFAVSDALVFPSYREGFPNVVMQAGAMGLPAIVTDINGCNEIIIEGQNGTIIPVKNTEALQNAMERMITDGKWRERLRDNARPMITSRYEQQVVWDALLEEYRSLTKGNVAM